MVKRISNRFVAFMLAVVFSAAFVPTMPASAATPIKLGDYVQMGTYYGEPILWRCVAFEKISGYDEEGNPIIDSTDMVTEYQEGYLPLMLSDRILCLKPYDAETSVSTNPDITTNSHLWRGCNIEGGDFSNYWADSNMRSWLNSSESDRNVEWLCGCAPIESKIYKGWNDYDQEAGFLSNFSQTEKNAMQKATQKSIVSYIEVNENIHTEGDRLNALDSQIHMVIQTYDRAYAEKVTDSVFLLDIKQANSVWKNSDVLGANYYIGEPTQQAIDNDESKLAHGEPLQTDEKWYYWLRTPYANSGIFSLAVDKTGEIMADYSYHSIIGVRPAFYLNQGQADFVKGNGAKDNPYVVDDTRNFTPIHVGDYVKMGTYYGEPIVWRCVCIDENKPLMLSDKIICLKPFDAGVSDNYETSSHSRDSYDRDWGGSNYWADSNMRSWLNSSASAGNVEWLCGNPPIRAKVGYNSYDQEAGFMTNFSDKEMNIVKEVSQKSIAGSGEIWDKVYTEGTERYNSTNDISEYKQYCDTAYAERVNDNFFLLDAEQAHKMYVNGDILGETYYIGELTQQAIDNDESKFVGEPLQVNQKWDYWLRYPELDGDETGCLSRTGYMNWWSARVYCGGVRPAFYMNQEVFVPESGAGTEAEPYIVDSASLLPGNNIFSVYNQDENIIVCNNSSKEYSGSVIIEEYDADNNLSDIYLTEIRLAGSEQIKAGIMKNNYKYKAYVWNSLNEMNPRASVYTFE